jgi:hypothetical protein
MNRDFQNVRMDADGDLIFFTVGLYKLFMQGGKVGQDAKLLYEHLMFTARLQATNTVRANDQYLRNGLGWGVDKLKAAKSWLRKRDLIRYVRRRDEHGKLGSIFIQITYLQSAAKARTKKEDDEFVEDPSQGSLFEESSTVPQQAETYDPEQTESHAQDNATDTETSGVKSTPVDQQPVVLSTSGVADHTCGFEKQMLKANKEMLKENKRNSLAQQKPRGEPGSRSPGTLKDSLAADYESAFTSQTPLESWKSIPKERKHLVDIAKRTRRLVESTPYESEGELAGAIMAEFAELRRIGRGDYWRLCPWVPSALTARWDVVIEKIRQKVESMVDDEVYREVGF